MTAQVFFVVAQAKDALLVPMAAFAQASLSPGTSPSPASTAPRPGGTRPNAAALPTTRGSTRTVKVLNTRGELEDRAVQIGVSNRVQAQVLTGLEEGERVVSGRSNGSNSSRPSIPPRL